MNNLIIKCGDKEIEVREIYIKQASLGASVADGKMLFDHGFKDDNLTAFGLVITGTWSPTPNPDHWILEDEETGAELKLCGSLAAALTTVTERYPVDDYLIVIGRAGGRGSRIQFDVYSHKCRVAIVYYSLWGKNGRTIQQESENRTKVSGDAT